MYDVYVLWNQIDNWLYKGLTNKLDRRLKQHRKGQVSGTGHHLPVELVYRRSFQSRQEAREYEKCLKSGVGREWLRQYLTST